MPRLRALISAAAAIGFAAAGLTVPAAPAQAAITQTVLFDKGEAGYGCYRIPAIVKTTVSKLGGQFSGPA